MAWSIDPILSSHQSKNFKCGKHPLDHWLKKFALPNHLNNISRTRVLIEAGDDHVRGYYALSASLLDRTAIPAEYNTKLPPGYPAPAILLAQLAVEKDLRGKGYGGALLAHALRTAGDVSENVGAFAVIVHAIDDEARSFYAHHGFREFVDNKLHLFLPTETARAIQ